MFAKSEAIATRLEAIATRMEAVCCASFDESKSRRAVQIGESNEALGAPRG